MDAPVQTLDPHSGPRIHPSARVDPSARIAESAWVGPQVVIGPDVIVGPHCRVGAHSVLHARAILVAHTTLGERNQVHPYAVLGGEPQDRSFDPERPGELLIGDLNTFREGVTCHRGNWNGAPTRIGSGNYLMAQAHVAHNAQVGDHTTLANGACLAGHARLGDRCVMSAFSSVHQFTHVGEGVMFRGHAGASMHVPPFLLIADINRVVGLNAVGLRRHPELTAEDREAVKRVFRALYRQRGASPFEAALAELEQQSLAPAAARFVAFCREALEQTPPRRRGLCIGRPRPTRGLAESALD
jgi:UDP-N-acetylglucosamine acyltransferase